MGRSRVGAVPRADVGRGEGHERRSRRHQHRLRLRAPTCHFRTRFSPAGSASAAASGRGCSTEIPDGCGDNLKLLTRTATNTYFPQVHTVISLPTEEDELSQLVDELSGDLAGVQTVQDVAQAKRFNPEGIRVAWPLSGRRIFERLQRIREGAKADASRSPKLSEFDTFASGRPEIGANHPTAKLYAQTLPRDVWADADAGTRPLGDQEPRRCASPEGGVLPLRVHAF